ncbi:DUF2085 domain-containing protein [bacterium]|nr:DUF2085 domain-containing protein [bacterium]
MNDFAGWFYTCGSALCHQLPDRSFFLSNMFLPVCARCAGIYIGASIGIFWMIFKGRFQARYTFSKMFVGFIVLSELYLLTDWWVDWPLNIARFSSGLVGGWAAALGVVSVLTFFLWKPEEQTIKKFGYQTVFIGIIILSINVVFIILPSLENIALFALWTLITFGVVGLFSVANSVMLLLIFDNLRHRVYRTKHLMQMLTTGLLMFLMEFAVVLSF